MSEKLDRKIRETIEGRNERRRREMEARIAASKSDKAPELAAAGK